MKKIVTIVIIFLVVLGFGFFLFKISPQDQQVASSQEDFDLSQVKPGSLSEPGPVVPEDHVLGNPNAKNTLVAYEDFQCPYCAQANDMLKSVPAQLQDTKLVFRFFPLTQIHRNSVSSAYAAEAAGAQGKYWEMHDLLFKNQAAWSELADPMDKFVELAQQAGVANIDQFKNDITSKKFKDRVQANLVESYNLNLQGTPSFFFNGKPVASTYNIEQLKKSVEAMYVK
jgi:protein-disulfide isomerase